MDYSSQKIPLKTSILYVQNGFGTQQEIFCPQLRRNIHLICFSYKICRKSVLMDF